MQRGWIAGRYNIKEEAHYGTASARWQSVNPTDTCIAVRKTCNNNNTVTHEKKRDAVIHKKR